MPLLSRSRRWPASLRLSPTLSFTLGACLSLSAWLSSASAVLVALAPGEQSAPLLERVLVTFDPLSESQTVVAQASLSGALKHFAVLTAVPKGVEISYTTTAIWNELNRYVGPKVIYERTLNITPYMYLWSLLSDRPVSSQASKERRGVWRSNHTGVYATEAALHEWLIAQGLTLSASHALGVKEIYQRGLAVAVIEVKPKRSPNHAHQETWTSTWIFTSPSASPHYWLARPRLPKPLIPDNQELDKRYPLSLTTLTEWPTKLAVAGERSGWGELREAMRSTHGEESLSEAQLTAYTQVGREEVARFNKRLSSTRWNFRRGGTLTQLEAQPREGVWRVSLERAYERPEVKRVIKVKARNYHLPLPLEPLFFSLYGLWWLWFRYAQAEP